MVQGGIKVGVSRKIADEAERDRLRDLGEKVKPPGMGIIIRTRAEGVGRTELQADIAFLTRLWSSIQRRAKRTPAPAVIHEDLSLVFEIIRDVFSSEVERFVVDDADVYAKVRTLVGQIVPELKSRVVRYTGEKPIFVEYDLEKQIERALRPRVWLPQGGHINVDQTEALTVIDVNSGKFTGARSLTDTVLRTNLQAVTEVVDQIRLRDVGGIIVVDFIDMDNANHRREVMARLKEELKKDRVRTRVAHLTPLGLVEMTRKRTGDTLNVQMQSTCPYCEGRGRIASYETTAIRVDDRIRELAAKDGAKDIRVTCSPGVGLQFIGVDGSEVGELEETLGRRIHVRCSTTIHAERFVINTGPPANLNQEGLPFTPGDVVTLEPSQALDIPSEGLVACVEGCLVHVPDAPHSIDHPHEVRLMEIGRSYVRATLATGKPHRRSAAAKPTPEPALEDIAALEPLEVHPAGEAEAVTEPAVGEPAARKRRRRPRGGRRRGGRTAVEQPAAAGEPVAVVAAEPPPMEEVGLAPHPAPEEHPAEPPPAPAKQPRHRPRSRRRATTPAAVTGEAPAEPPSVEEPAPPEPAKRKAARIPLFQRAAPEPSTEPVEAPREEPAPAPEPAKPEAAKLPLFQRAAPEPSSEPAEQPQDQPPPARKPRWRTPIPRKRATTKATEEAPAAPAEPLAAPEAIAPVTQEAAPTEAPAPKAKPRRRARTTKKKAEEEGSPPTEEA
jgi:ribonuclease G